MKFLEDLNLLDLQTIFLNKFSFEDIVRKTDFENLKYIAAGTIPTNPSEILGSDQMRDFIDKLKE
jgi:Mrp family chromosome partitioning ATPase